MENAIKALVFLFATAWSASPQTAGADGAKHIRQKLANTVITLQQAVDIALAHQGGQAFSAELEKDSFSIEYKVKILRGKRRYKLTIDGVTGRVKRVRERND